MFGIQDLYGETFPLVSYSVLNLNMWPCSISNMLILQGSCLLEYWQKHSNFTSLILKIDISWPRVIVEFGKLQFWLQRIFWSIDGRTFYIWHAWFWLWLTRRLGLYDGPCPTLLRGDKVLIFVPSDCKSGLLQPSDPSSLPDGQNIACPIRMSLYIFLIYDIYHICCTCIDFNGLSGWGGYWFVVYIRRFI